MSKLADIERDVVAEAEIDRGRLSEEFAKQPSQYAYWSFRAEEAKNEKNELKLQLEVFQASEGKRLRDTGEKLTEKALDNLIKSSDKYMEIHKAYNKAIFRAGIYSSAVGSFENKAQMLISIGAHQRKEMDGAGGLFINNEEKEKVKETIGRK